MLFLTMWYWYRPNIRFWFRFYWFLLFLDFLLQLNCEKGEIWKETLKIIFCYSLIKGNLIKKVQYFRNLKNVFIFGHSPKVALIKLKYLHVFSGFIERNRKHFAKTHIISALAVHMDAAASVTVICLDCLLLCFGAFCECSALKKMAFIYVLAQCGAF